MTSHLRQAILANIEQGCELVIHGVVVAVLPLPPAERAAALAESLDHLMVDLRRETSRFLEECAGPYDEMMADVRTVNRIVKGEPHGHQS